MPLAPIVLFAYNRADHLTRTLAALSANALADESDLYVYSDGPNPNKPQDAERVAAVRRELLTVTGFRTVKVAERSENWGLARSVIEGVTEVINEHQQAIVVEDDLITARSFLSFMNEALRFYADQPHIFSISGYTLAIAFPKDYPHDVYLFQRASSWGWATWADRWEKADWKMHYLSDFERRADLRRGFEAGGADLVPMLRKQARGWINSWMIRWSYAHFAHQAYGVYPRRSRVQNVGHDLTGVNSNRTTRFDVPLSNEPYELVPLVAPDPRVLEPLQGFVARSPLRRLINFVRLR